MELVAGESFEPVLDDPAVEPGLAAARMRRAAEVLPRLHDVDLDTVPGVEAPLTPADELARWARTLRAVPTDLVAGGDRLLDLLARQHPSRCNRHWYTAITASATSSPMVSNRPR